MFFCRSPPVVVKKLVFFRCAILVSVLYVTGSVSVSYVIMTTIAWSSKFRKRGRLLCPIPPPADAAGQRRLSGCSQETERQINIEYSAVDKRLRITTGCWDNSLGFSSTNDRIIRGLFTTTAAVVHGEQRSGKAVMRLPKLSNYHVLQLWCEEKKQILCSCVCAHEFTIRLLLWPGIS